MSVKPLCPPDGGLRGCLALLPWQPHPDALDLGVAQELVQALFATDTALLDAAVRRAQRVPSGEIHPDVSGLDPPREAKGFRVIVRVDRRAEPVDDIVDLADHLVLVVPREDSHHRAEDLLLRDLHFMSHTVEDGGPDEESPPQAGVFRCPSAVEQPGALPLACLDVAEDLLELLPGDEAAPL